MAYDQHAVYQPPRRAYLNRTPQSPAAGAYDNHDYAEYASTPYDQQQQPYGQAYHQPNHSYNDAHDQRMNDGYGQGYGGGGYGMPPQRDRQYQQSQERSYDPRYQPRAPRAPPDRGLPPVQRGPPPRREPQWVEPRPRQNTHPQTSFAQRDHYAQPNVQYTDPPPAPTHPPNANSKTSMEEWKAREKAKMKAQAVSPEVMPFDNAFPVFGNKPQKRDRHDSERSSGPSQRGSTDQRPTTAPGQRSGASRENSHQNETHVAQAPQRRPSLDGYQTAPEGHNARFDAAPPPQSRQGRPGNDQAPPEQLQRQPAANDATPFDFQYPEQWPMVAGYTPSKETYSPPQIPPTNTNGHDFAQTPEYRPDYEPDQPVSKPPPRQRAPPPIETSRQYQRPFYNDHHPLSPAAVPPRPSTSQGPRSQPAYAQASHVPQHHTAETYSNLPQKPWVQADRSRVVSVGDIIDDYGAESAPGPEQLKRRPTTREEEIEAEMPDFDSAAPSQTSMLHKRNQTVDQHLAGSSTNSAPSQAPPPLPAPGLPHSSSAPDVRYDQAPFQHAGRAPPGPMRGPPRRGMTGDGYGTPGPGPQTGYGPRARGPPPQDPRYQQGPMQPSRAPFAHEPQGRRSLDDGWPMPIRSAPPEQQSRFNPNGRSGPDPRGGYPPHRPDFDRMQTSQTTWSDPGLGGAGTAPPPRHGLMSPPHGPNGMQSSQQRSAPEQATVSNNPDALPYHPVPVRPGLLAQGSSPPNQPPPIRHQNGSSPAALAPSHQRQGSADHFAQPVTHAELERLRTAVDANPNNHKQALLYVKKLVEAASVLASEGGRADPKVTAKNREKWTMEAYKRLKRVVSAGYPEAQFYLADCYGQGMLGLEVDTKEAFKLYQAAAKAGHPQAAYRTAVCCEMGPEEGGGTSRDFSKAVQWYRRAATLGDGPAMYKIGAVLLKGLLGQQRNITEAVIWLKRGAEHADGDNPHALHELATLYESTNTNPEIRNKVVADDGYARELFMQAAQLGYKSSQFRLGQAYEYGNLGLQIDNRSSIAWYTKAAAQGEHQAELALSGWYLTGAEGILEHSDTEAYLWARKAASSEPPLAKAMFAMGYFAENGIGCPPSMDEARKWYGRAACKCTPGPGDHQS